MAHSVIKYIFRYIQFNKVFSFILFSRNLMPKMMTKMTNWWPMNGPVYPLLLTMKLVSNWALLSIRKYICKGSFKHFILTTYLNEFIKHIKLLTRWKKHKLFFFYKIINNVICLGSQIWIITFVILGHILFGFTIQNFICNKRKVCLYEKTFTKKENVIYV